MATNIFMLYTMNISDFFVPNYVKNSRNLLYYSIFLLPRIGDKQKTYSEKILDELLEKAR